MNPGSPNRDSGKVESKTPFPRISSVYRFSIHDIFPIPFSKQSHSTRILIVSLRLGLLVVATVTAAKMALPLSTENCFLLSLDFATYGPALSSLNQTGSLLSFTIFARPIRDRRGRVPTAETTDERSEEDVQRVSRCGKQFLDPECENRRGFVAKDCEIQSKIEAEYLFQK